MKALVKQAAGPGFVLRDVPVPTIRDNEVLIKVRRAGVCGTDVHIYEWDDWASGRCVPPFTVGHEFAGDVAQVGSMVTDVKRRRPGDGRGTHRGWAMHALPHGECARVPVHEGDRRRSRRLLRGVHRDAGDERLAPRRQHLLRRGRHPRSDGERLPHGAHGGHSGRDGAHHRVRADRDLRGGDLQGGGRVARDLLRCERHAARARAADGRDGRRASGRTWRRW